MELSIWFYRGHCWRGALQPSFVSCGLQAKLLPVDRAQLKVYGVSTHRLALYLSSTEQLLPIVRGTLLQEMGFASGHIRLHNLV